MNTLSIFLPIADAVIDAISIKIQSKTSPELDKLVRVMAASCKAGLHQAIIEYQLDK
jgi:hypothetical protein